MQITLITYASKSYIPSQIRLIESARRYAIDRCVSYSPACLYASGYFFFHHQILRQHRGAGYWLWKPYIILKTLQRIPEGDIVLYLDVDNIIIENLNPLFELAQDNVAVLFANHGRLNREWTKRDSFVLMNCDTSEFHDAEQVDAAQIILRNTPVSRKFVAEWLKWCEDSRVLTDEQNVCGLPNLEGFIEHRHDQSVLSLMARRWQLEIFRSATYRGNHLKQPVYRIASERLAFPYSPEPWANSSYGTLIEGQAGLINCDSRSALRKSLSRLPYVRRALNIIRKWFRRC